MKSRPPKKLSTDERIKAATRNRRAIIGEDVECKNCHKTFHESDYSALSRAIMNRQPACSLECNKALGQV